MKPLDLLERFFRPYSGFQECVRCEQAEQALEAARREHERLAQQRQQVSTPIRGIGHAYHCVDLARGVRRNGCLIAADIQGHIEQIRAMPRTKD